MKAIVNFLKTQWITATIIVGLILLKIFTGIPFWCMLAVVVFFTAVQIIKSGKINRQSRGLATIMVVVFLVTLGDSYWKKNLVKSFGQKEVLKARVDQKIFKLMGDEVEVKAKNIWELQKVKNGKEFLAYYNDLLAQGKTKEAADTLAGFKRHWDLKLQSQATSPPVISVPIAPPPTANTPVAPPLATVGRDSIFRKGTYYIDVKGETSFNCIIMPDKVGCARYAMTSTENSFVIKFSDGENVPATAFGLPYRERPKFKLFSEKGERVKLEVS